MVVSGDEWKLLCMVRSYHVYKHMWDLYLDDNFMMEHQRRIPYNKHTIHIAILCTCADELTSLPSPSVAFQLGL